MFGFIKHLLKPNVAIMAWTSGEDGQNETLNQLIRAVLKHFETVLHSNRNQQGH